ncbi:helix-turn-helix domain-containing protein [Nocardia sp. NPDC050630]|uniref:helix-turn-helix domain-containing protein n=1 Tax=Nocardia sp. NPDC050630 TaxID=3364321 RepID=UPI0037B746BA
MDNRSEVREFLSSRRARITPEQVGLPHYGGNRRVPGLRRDEVALLAGISVDYYTRLERGNLRGASESVLAAIARALRLEEAERIHLFALAQAAESRRAPTRRRPARQPLRASVRAIIDGLADLPVTVTNGRMEVIAANRLGRALYAPLFDAPHIAANQARFAFLDPRATAFWVDWEAITAEVVGSLRAAAARDPFDRDLTDLIGELATRSDRFGQLWASQDVFLHRGGLKRINHPVVGRLDLTYEILRLDTDPDLAILTYTAEPGSPSHDAVKLLTTWAATVDDAARATAPDS